MTMSVNQAEDRGVYHRFCHGHVPAYFFSLRVSYVTGHWSVTGRSARQ